MRSAMPDEMEKAFPPALDSANENESTARPGIEPRAMTRVLQLFTHWPEAGGE